MCGVDVECREASGYVDMCIRETVCVQCVWSGGGMCIYVRGSVDVDVGVCVCMRMYVCLGG